MAAKLISGLLGMIESTAQNIPVDESVKQTRLTGDDLTYKKTGQG